MERPPPLLVRNLPSGLTWNAFRREYANLRKGTPQQKVAQAWKEYKELHGIEKESIPPTRVSPVHTTPPMEEMKKLRVSSPPRSLSPRTIRDIREECARPIAREEWLSLIERTKLGLIAIGDLAMGVVYEAASHQAHLIASEIGRYGLQITYQRRILDQPNRYLTTPFSHHEPGELILNASSIASILRRRDVCGTLPGGIDRYVSERVREIVVQQLTPLLRGLVASVSGDVINVSEDEAQETIRKRRILESILPVERGGRDEYVANAYHLLMYCSLITATVPPSDLDPIYARDHPEEIVSLAIEIIRERFPRL